MYYIAEFCFVTGGAPDLSKISVMALQGDPVSYHGCVRKLIINNVNYPLTQSGEYLHSFQISYLYFMRLHF